MYPSARGPRDPLARFARRFECCFDRWCQEANIAKTMLHPNVTAIFDILKGPEGDTIIEMEPTTCVDVTHSR
jgi:hypothetical protein